MDFDKRFNIEISLTEAKQKFINRIDAYYDLLFYDRKSTIDKRQLNTYISFETGFKKIDFLAHPKNYYENDFYKCIKVSEVIYDFFQIHHKREKENLENIFINLTGREPIGVQWKNETFLPEGAKILDAEIINKNLDWLNEKQYNSVYTPFSKGLNHFLNSKSNPLLLRDVVTDMYEALETFAKIITGKDKDLSANRELLIKLLNVSDKYKEILKEYIEYANEFRHGSTGTKPELKPYEVESFIYLTGLFIRLGIESKG